MPSPGDWKPRLKRGISRIVGRGRALVPPRGVRCLVYHSIVAESSEDPMQMTTPVRLFKEQMAYLAAHRYRVESALSMVERLRRGDLADPKTVILTFDDGLLDQHQLALPVLQTYAFPATFFLMPAALDGQLDQLGNRYAGHYLTWDHVRQLHASGFAHIGCHGATHQRLRRCSREALRREIVDAKARLEDGLGHAVPLFAYPFGSFDAWDQQALAEIKRAGFLGAFTSVFGLNTPATDPYLLRRVRVSWQDELPAFADLLAGAYDWYAAVQRLQGWPAR